MLKEDEQGIARYHDHCSLERCGFAWTLPTAIMRHFGRCLAGSKNTTNSRPRTVCALGRPLVGVTHPSARRESVNENIKLFHIVVRASGALVCGKSQKRGTLFDTLLGARSTDCRRRGAESRGRLLVNRIGRRAQSIAFLSPPGIERSYSGITNI